jgi:hypothetical protein
MRAQETRRRHVTRVVAANISDLGEGQLPTGNAHGGWLATRHFFLLLLAAATLTGCGAGTEGPQDSPAPPPATEAPPSTFALDPSIPQSDPKTYAAVEDAKDWKNPFLIVGANGIEIVTAGDRQAPVAIEALAEALTKLPATAWPYGRVVAARTSANGDAPAPDTEARIEEALQPLRVVVEWWPSE